MHVAVIGTGRVGRYTLMLLANESWVDKLTLVDIKPGLAKAVEEEIRHALASIRHPIEIESFTASRAVEQADIILITAGTPRTPDMKERTNLTEQNAAIIKEIANGVVPSNPNARYVIVTNPVDAMATLFKEISGAEWVISTGTNLESQRLRAELAKQLDVSITEVQGFVGGEHGQRAVFLWSTVKIDGLSLKKYKEMTGKTIDKAGIIKAVKETSKHIIQASGGTRQGPATSFRDILRSIALDENRILSIAAPYKVKNVAEQLMVSIPQIVGKNLRYTIEHELTQKEREELEEAANRIHETYTNALATLNG
jgi:malate dehydrogenase